MQFTGFGKMREKPDKPLTPPELFQDGIEMTREIRKRIVEARRMEARLGELVEEALGVEDE